ILRASILPQFYDDIAHGYFGDIPNYNEMPLDIYEEGYFSEEQKGKILLPLSEDEDEKNHSRHTANQYWGLMKGYMALNENLLISHEIFHYIKLSDKAAYNKDAL